MLLIQMCGLSGSGKTTLANGLKNAMHPEAVEVLDGDAYRKGMCSDLGFSKEDRQTNIRRLAFVADRFRAQGVVSVIAAINPYDAVRQEVAAAYAPAYLVWVKCSLEQLVVRDTKGLYKRALLPEGHPDRVSNLTGVNDPFEPPAQPHLTIDTGTMNEQASIQLFRDFVTHKIAEARH